MKTTDLKVRLTFMEDVLGTASNDPEIHAEFIASKSPDPKTIEDEVAAIGVEAAVEKSTTVFPRDENSKPIFYDYQIRGFFKEACSCLKKVDGTLSSKIKAYKKMVDGQIFVAPRKIVIDMKGMELSNCQRPLRASTAQGERISLANSEVVPAGSAIEFTVLCLNESDIKVVKEWLEYGAFKGLGQWRNSGKGRFEVEYIE